MKHLRIRIPSFVGLGTVLGLLVTAATFGQIIAETKTITLTVDDPRPMAAAILKLEELSGIPINYEDVPVYYSADLKDVTEEVSRTRTSDRRIMVARGGQLSVPIVVDASTGKLNNPEAVKDALLTVGSAYNSSGLPGGFDVEYYNGVFFVKPVSYRDERGASRPMTAILSTPISLSEEKRTRLETIQLILQQLSKAAGSDVVLTTNLGQPSDVIFGCNNEPADHAIARLLATKSTPASSLSDTAWDVGLSYGVGYLPQWGYMLDIHRVPNSRWWVSPPAKPYSPPPRTGSGGGRIRR
ncbi:MAG: hypothetical protein HY649_00975 [Acidobacteria bacterium]|nr:hypothetical protein [Acidobacteriota bacterium]